MSMETQPDASAHIARYEELRRHMVKQRSLSGRLGLAILLQRGLAAWLEQWSKMPAQISAPSTDTSRRPPLLDDISADVINVLAAMALGRMQEVHT